MKETFIANGMTDFIAKPIIAKDLNFMLYQYLPRSKVELLDKAPENPVTSNNGESTTIDALKTVDGLDVTEGLSHSNNDPDFYLTTLAEVQRQIPLQVDAMYGELKAGKWHDFGIRSHSLKSMFASIGEGYLSTQGKRFEMSAKEGNMGKDLVDAVMFTEEVDFFGDKLAAAMKRKQKGKDETTRTEETGKAGEKFSLEDLRRKWNDLIDACESADTEAIDGGLADLRQRWRGVFAEAALEKIGGMIEDMDYDKAAEALRTLAAMV
jgi:hypothetical protein